MKGYNRCAWLKVGELEVCGKSCCQEYCKIHLAKIRNDSKIPVPCRSVARGFRVRYRCVDGVVEIKFDTSI